MKNTTRPSKKKASKTLLLVFAGERGESLGNCVVDVTEEQMLEGVEITKQMSGRRSVPKSAAWITAAARAAWKRGCNPGGSVRAQEVSPEIPVPRFKLLPHDEMGRMIFGDEVWRDFSLERSAT